MRIIVIIACFIISFVSTGCHKGVEPRSQSKTGDLRVATSPSVGFKRDAMEYESEFKNLGVENASKMTEEERKDVLTKLRQFRVEKLHVSDVSKDQFDELLFRMRRSYNSSDAELVELQWEFVNLKTPEERYRFMLALETILGEFFKSNKKA